MKALYHVYPIGEEDKHDLSNDPKCPCRPDFICCECRLITPCIHGDEKHNIVSHRQAS